MADQAHELPPPAPEGVGDEGETNFRKVLSPDALEQYLLVLEHDEAKALEMRQEVIDVMVNDGIGMLNDDSNSNDGLSATSHGWRISDWLRGRK